MATLAAPSTEYGFGDPILSSANDAGLDMRGSVKDLVVGGGGVEAGPNPLGGLEVVNPAIEPVLPADELIALIVVINSRRLLRMSSSRVLVASFSLLRSEALSLLRWLRCFISCCKLVAMVVKLWIEEDSASDCCDRTPLVTVANGVSGGSLALRVWSASMVADGGVFSPRIDLAGAREPLLDGVGVVSLKQSRGVGVGVVSRERRGDLERDFSGEP
jgi:hypothetical protein